MQLEFGVIGCLFLVCFVLIVRVVICLILIVSFRILCGFVCSCCFLGVFVLFNVYFVCFGVVVADVDSFYILAFVLVLLNRLSFMVKVVPGLFI